MGKRYISGHVSANTKEDIMRDMMTAVFMCIAILAIVGCDSGTEVSPTDKSPRTGNSLNDKGAVVGDGGSSEYDFRQVRWGDSKDEVKSSEYDIPTLELGVALIYTSTLNRILMSSEPDIPTLELEDALIYASTLESIPVRIVYSFDVDKKRLNSAYYSIDKLPEGVVRDLMKYARKLHGEPNRLWSSTGMDWVTNRSWISLSLKKVVTDSQTVPYWDVMWRYTEFATPEIH